MAAAAAAAVAWTGQVASGDDRRRPLEPAAAPAVTYVVRDGDTLWELARARVGPEGDPRPLVRDIREANGLAPSSPLLPGSVLTLPAA